MNISIIIKIQMILKNIVKMSSRSIGFMRPLALYQQKFIFEFAKVSKKDQIKAQKKKQKSMVKQQLGGNIKQIDLNKYDQHYSQVISQFKEQLSSIRIGRLQVSSISNVTIKIKNQSSILASLAQISSKDANTCVVSPFNSDEIQLIQKSLRIWNSELDISKHENTLILVQNVQGKDIRDKYIQKVKKLANDRKEQLRKLRSSTQQQLRKFKKIVPEDRLRTIESQAKALFEKRSTQIDKLQKQKEKQLLK